MGGPMQRMTPPRGMVPLGPQVHTTNNYSFLLADLCLYLITLILVLHCLKTESARRCSYNTI